MMFDKEDKCQKNSRFSRAPAFCAALYVLMNNLADARGYLEQASTICSELVRKYPQVEEYRKHLSIFKRALGELR